MRTLGYDNFVLRKDGFFIKSNKESNASAINIINEKRDLYKTKKELINQYKKFQSDKDKDKILVSGKLVKSKHISVRI